MRRVDVSCCTAVSAAAVAGAEPAAVRQDNVTEGEGGEELWVKMVVGRRATGQVQELVSGGGGG